MALGVFLVLWAMPSLAILIRHIVGGIAMGALELPASSVVVWVGNVLAFSLLFWQLDGGGPIERTKSGAFQAD
ncbi:MAG TPA: hypothetical protein PLB26_21195 [Rubrivivax sp.]|nr:hypothetical protein [Rubrivivax sp.]